MNDTSLQTIDDTSEPQQTVDPAESANKGSGPILWISGFVIIITIALLIGGIWLWTQYQQLLETQQQVTTHSNRTMVALQQDLSDLNNRMEDKVLARVEALKADQAAMVEKQQRLTRSVNAVKALAAPEQQGWALAEAEYLIRVANHLLIFRDDSKAASEALQAADQRLHDLDDPAALEVRTILAWEISTLNALPQPDIEGMALTLSSLAKLAETLPLPGPESRVETDFPTTVADSAPESETDRSLQQAMDKVWADVRKLVVIRKKGEIKQEVLPPKESYFLRQNLALKLQAARLNLLQRSPGAYQQDMKTAGLWTRRYFLADRAEVQHLVQELDRLAGVDIASQKPDISGSLRQITLLQAHLAGKQQGERIVEERKAAEARSAHASEAAAQ